MVSRELLRRRVGGRWAISWQGYVLLLFVSVPGSVVLVPAFTEPDQQITGLVVSTLAYGAAGLVLALASITILRHRRQHPVAVWVVVLVGGAAWLMRSAVFAVYLEVTDLPVDTPLGNRLVVGFILGAFWVPVVAWLFATIDDFRLQRRKLVNELIRQESQAKHSEAYLNVLRGDLWQRVATAVPVMAPDNSRSPQNRQTAGDTPPDSLVDSLEGLATTIRSTSHDVAHDVSTQANASSRVRAGDVLRLTARRPFMVWPMAFYLLVVWIYLERFASLTVVVTCVVVIGVWGVGVSWVANRLAARAAEPSMLAYAVSVAAQCATSLVVIAALLIIGVDISTAIPLGLTLGLTFALVIVAAGIARGVNVANAEVMTDVRASISAAEVRHEAQTVEESRIMNDIATHLHGTVTAHLTAATLRLRIAMLSGDVTAAQQAYAQARRQLDLDLRSTVLTQTSDLAGLLDDLRRSWAGICDVRVNIATLPAVGPTTVRDIVDVVTEAVSNAVRHGDAQRVEVSIRSDGDGDGDGDEIVVTVMDDGRGVADINPSQGIALFERIGTRGWTLRRASTSGMVLNVRMAVD